MQTSAQLLRAKLLTESPLLTNAEVEAKLAKVAAHAERHAKRPFDPVGREHPRSVSIPPRRRQPGFGLPRGIS